VQPKGLPGKPDFYFHRPKLAVFVDGCFWHGCAACGHTPRTNSAYWSEKVRRNRDRDVRTTAALRGLGVEVIRLWEHELREDLAGCVAVVARSLR
jgi:DNA mismatch endonuclease (patch repair protein)